MRAISMTPFDALAVADGLNSSGPFDWSTDSLPPSMWELVAIHSAEDYPPDAAALARAERLTPAAESLNLANKRRKLVQTPVFVTYVSNERRRLCPLKI